MRYDRPIQFNRNPITSSRPLRKLGRNLFWSLGVPVVLTLVALILSGIAETKLFLVPGNTLSTIKRMMIFVNSIVCTLIAALALNSNLNSGRMDFSLGATGILATVISSKFIPDFADAGLVTFQGIIIFTILTIIFGMILGLIHSLIFIVLKLPPIVTSLGMCLVFEGVAKVLVGHNTQILIRPSAITSNLFLEPIIIIPMLIILVLIMSLIFCYSRYGYEKNALVYDQKISVDTGIK